MRQSLESSESPTNRGGGGGIMSDGKLFKDVAEISSRRNVSVDDFQHKIIQRQRHTSSPSVNDIGPIAPDLKKYITIVKNELAFM